MESMTLAAMCWYKYEVTAKDIGQMDALETERNEFGKRFVMSDDDGNDVAVFHCYRRANLNIAFVVLCYAIQFAGNFIAFLLLINTVINMVYTTEYDIRKRRKEFGLLKALGYQDEELRRLILTVRKTTV